MEKILSLQFRCIPNSVFIVLSLILSLFIVLLFMQKRERRIVKLSVFWMLLIEYVFIVFCSTVICRDSHPEITRIELMPFWNYRDVFLSGKPMYYWEVILNIVLYVPIGFLLGGVRQTPSKSLLVGDWKVGTNGRIGNWRDRGRCLWVVGISAGLSILTEVLQLILHRGLCETDDVIHNTLGAMMGWGVYLGTCKTVKTL